MAIVGGGAAGTLVAVHLAHRWARDTTAGRALDVVLVDPGDRPGRGVAYSTTDRLHLLNVPAAGMSAIPARPSHFLDWLRQGGWPDAGPGTFAPRAGYGRYLEATLAELLSAAPGLRLVHRRTVATAARPTASGVRLDLAGGATLLVDAVVLATGLLAPGTDWAPAALRNSGRFVADPWAPGGLDRLAACDGDVLLVGTGLTAVDLALTLARDGRTVHAISRRGRLPRAHATRRTSGAARPGAVPYGPDADAQRIPAARSGALPTDLGECRRLVRDTVTAAVTTHGDWRPAFDTLRPITGTLWAGLSGDERVEFLRTDAAWWDLHRHRMPPASAAAVAALRSTGALHVSSDEVLAVADVGTGLDVTLASGRSVIVDAVVNCTGPQGDLRRSADPLHRDLLARGAAVPGPLGLGVATRDGRLVDVTGADRAPVWTLGALRRGELWETTAVPEIGAQAAEVATDVLGEVLREHPASPRRHPVDVMGLPISTGPAAAAAFNRGLDTVLRVQSGAVEAFTEAVSIDPDFALGHAALAMLGYEGGATVDVDASLEAARRAVRGRGSDRERSFVAVVDARVRDCRGAGAAALVRHLHDHPRDALALSAAVPTIAFSGVTDVQQEAWELVEGLAPAYDGPWWYRSLLAFVRQDQQRYDEAGELSESVLALEPASGHAVHARTHAYYETGAHAAGLRWLDPWISSCGRRASHRAHFSWHAALHELATGDGPAVRRRYLAQLAPPTVTGVRGIVDSASLLWRCKVTDTWAGELPIDDVLGHADPELLERPATPFTAMHAAIALTAAADAPGVRALSRHASSASDPVLREVVAPLCQGLLAVVEERWDDAVRSIRQVLPRLVPVGGSLAQREVVEDTYLFALVSAGRCEEAVALLDARLDRRPSPLDRRRRAAATTAP